MQSAADQLANDVVAHMMKEDRFSQWLGISVLEVREGYSRIAMSIRPDMVNAYELHNGKSTGLYQISIHNQEQKLVAQFKGLCFRTDKKLISA